MLPPPTRALAGGGNFLERRQCMKEDEERTPQPWEAVDPKPPVIHSAVPGTRGENHRQSK